jgi:hypothetical protein
MPKNKRNRNRNRNRRPRGRNNNTIATTTAIPKNLRGSFPFPESRICKLTSVINFVMQGATTFVVNDFRVNSLYQFDVTGGTTHNFSGDTQLSAIYDSYHVQHIKVSYLLSGNETGQPVFFGLVFKDDQPSVSITTLAKAVNALEVAPTTGVTVVGQASGQPIFRSRSFGIKVGAIVGNNVSYNADLSYTSSFGNTNPAQAVWMSAIAYGVGGNITGGVIVSLRTELTIRAYSIKTLQE